MLPNLLTGCAPLRVPIGAPAPRSGHKLVTSERPLAGPNDCRAAAVHADFSIQRGHVIADRVLGEPEYLTHFGIASTLADERKNFTLAICEHVKVGRSRVRLLGLPPRLDFFDYRAGKPAIREHSFDRRKEIGGGLVLICGLLKHANGPALAVNSDVDRR